MPIVFISKLRITFSFTKKYSTGMNYGIFEIMKHIYVLLLFSKYITHLFNICLIHSGFYHTVNQL